MEYLTYGQECQPKHISDAKRKISDYSHVENTRKAHPGVKFKNDKKILEKGGFPYSHPKSK